MPGELANRAVCKRLAAAMVLALPTLLFGAGCEAAGEDLAGGLSTAVEEAAGEGGGSSSQGGGTYTVTVERVIDGDTLELSRPIMGITDLRLVGVDAPESVGGEVDPLGKKAASFTESSLEGERVQVIVAADPVDPYGRLLGNVSYDGGLFAEKLLAAGLAQTLFFEPNLAHKAEFEAIQSRARAGQRGIWGLPPGRACALADRGNGVVRRSTQC